MYHLYQKSAKYEVNTGTYSKKLYIDTNYVHMKDLKVYQANGSENPKSG